MFVNGGDCSLIHYRMLTSWVIGIHLNSSTTRDWGLLRCDEAWMLSVRVVDCAVF